MKIMLFNNLLNDFVKKATGYGFYLGVILTFILCIFAPVYFDFSSCENYTTIRCLSEFNRTFMMNDITLCSYNIAIQGCDGFLSMFTPIIVSFVSVPIICDEYNSGNKRFNILRTTKFNYYISKYITSSICGGLVLMLGYCLYIIFSYSFFPNVSNYPLEMHQEFMDNIINTEPRFEEHGYFYMLLKKCMGVFIYGVIASVPAIILSNIIRNKYLVICIPFFVKYVTVQSCSKFSSELMEKTENTEALSLNVIKTINPDSLLNSSIFSNVKSYIIIYNILLFLIGIILFHLSAEVKYDCGE